MNVYILDKVIEYDNEKSIIDSMFKDIDRILEDSNYYFSHLTIDDTEIYGDYHNYFLDNIKNIREIKVMTCTMKELIENILLYTMDYLGRAIPEINILSNEFYKTPIQDSWFKLSELLEGIAWIIDSFATIDTNSKLEYLVSSYEEWNLYAKSIYSLQGLLSELEETMKNHDTVSLADILSYELTPLFTSMQEKLEELLSGGIKDYGIS